MATVPSWQVEQMKDSGALAKSEWSQKVVMRSVVVVSADAGMRQRLTASLLEMRWAVREAGGGAAAMGLVEEQRPEAMIVDDWLPDLEVSEFVRHVQLLAPDLDLLRVDGSGIGPGKTRSPRRNELLHSIRSAQDLSDSDGSMPRASGKLATARQPAPLRPPAIFRGEAQAESMLTSPLPGRVHPIRKLVALPEMIGESAGMLELARLIRLVAPRNATVLIEGETGTGKEVVAKALHRLSLRAAKPFVVLNCAAIPEALLEAELFGHTRGAFTGAVTARTGRIEAAHGGTLFLDEIGEMPLALQAKMLRFLECGELQKVGENETVRVDVRVIAATHQDMLRRAEEKTFRLDLYHRLAVFPLEVPALRERLADLPLLVEFFLEQMGRESPRKGISTSAMERLAAHEWTGNVRELMHVLERAAILAEDRAEIGAEEVRLRSRSHS
jgi:DNA-binding NtrC family response regulator